MTKIETIHQQLGLCVPAAWTPAYPRWMLLGEPTRIIQNGPMNLGQFSLATVMLVLEARRIGIIKLYIGNVSHRVARQQGQQNAQQR